MNTTSGEVIGYDQSGTLTVAANPSDAAALKDLLAYQQSLGLAVHPRSASQCRTLVPALSPMIGAGVEVPGDHQVDNRALLAALVTACQRHGVSFRRTSVTEVIDGPAVHLAEGGRLDADLILLAAGTGTPGIKGLDAAALPEIRPVKGHILRLAQGPNVVRLDRTVRALVNGRSVYLVPRADGSVVVGATVEERGDDLGVQAGAVHQLLDDARTVVPGIDEMHLLESSAGLRPATPDNIPFMGWTGLPGVAAACGHYRNGILLAPYTSSAIASGCCRREHHPQWHGADGGRRHLHRRSGGRADRRVRPQGHRRGPRPLRGAPLGVGHDGRLFGCCSRNRHGGRRWVTSTDA